MSDRIRELRKKVLRDHAWNPVDMTIGELGKLLDCVEAPEELVTVRQLKKMRQGHLEEGLYTMVIWEDAESSLEALDKE